MKPAITVLLSIILTSCGGADNKPSPSAIAASAPAATAGKQIPAITIPKAGGETDLIVVFDDTAVETEATARMRRLGVGAGHENILELKAARLKVLKAQTLAPVETSDFVERTQFSHLPITHIAVRDLAAAERLRRLPGVVGLFKNELRQKLFLVQSLALVRQPQAAVAGAAGTGTSVVVLDQLIDYTNPAFGNCTSPGQPASCKILIARDVDGKQNDGLSFQENHGTNVAATVVAVAPATKIIGFNVFNGPSATDTDVLSGINWAIANKTKYNIVAVNMSLGGGKSTFPVTSGPYYSGISKLRIAGIVPVAAAGNSGYKAALSLPAAVQGVVSVGAVYDDTYGDGLTYSECTDSSTYTDLVACFSDSASFLTILAPGARSDAGGFVMQGTSQASPFVAGAVAVLKAAYPNDTVDQTILRLTRGPLVFDPKSGVSTPRLQLDNSLSLPACQYSVTNSITVPASGTNGINATDIHVSTQLGCTWSAISQENWITTDRSIVGSGNGIVQYSVSPNNSSSARAGTISVAGASVQITQSAGVALLSSSSNIWINGGYGYNAPGDGSITLNVDEILNSSRSTTSGTLRLELWLSKQPFDGAGLTGWKVATARIINSSNGTLQPGYVYRNLRLTTTLENLPPPGRYYATFVVSEYTSLCGGDGFCFAATGNFNNYYIIGDRTPPTTPTGVTASSINSTSINLKWNPSSDDSAVTEYKVYANGDLLGSVEGKITAAKAYNLQPQTTYSFRIEACDSAQNCSAQSASASATTREFTIQSGIWWNPAESGRGFTVDISGNAVSLAAFLYDSTGRATWYLTSGQFNPDGTYDGQFLEYRGGQSLSGTYAAPSVKGSASPVHMSCTSATSCSLTWAGGTLPIQRYLFSGAPSAAAPVSGTWWNPAESGRGYVLEVQGNLLSFAAFLYDVSGNATWYLASGPFNSDGSFDGDLIESTKGQTLIGSYVAPSAKGTVSRVHLSCTSTTSCRLTWAGGTVPIQRYVF